ncbi:MAG: rod shape-determining protein MreC [Saprospirales bacterium]|nr:MAG: rod shape-determining protein MreC [Saprospirales bacterium]
MLNLLRFIIKNGAVFLFFLLQVICFWMIVTFNESQRTIFLHTTVLLTSGVQEKISNFYDYWNLYHVSDSLAAENALLLEKVMNQTGANPDTLLIPFEGEHFFSVIPAKVIYNSISGRNNQLLINRGKSAGLDRGMGVIDKQNGIVGITRDCTQNYCRLISILHTQSMISARIKDRNYFGSAVWRNTNPQLLQLEAIPVHAVFESGDTVVTSGYSTVFPAGIPIGIIEDYHLPPGSNFYQIDLRLINDLARVKYVYIVNDLMAEEKMYHLNLIENE